MKSTTSIFLTIFCFAAVLCVAHPGAVPELGFPDLDGNVRHPLEPAGKIASVVIFYSQDCPISNGYAPEINRIAASHTNCAFYIVQVDPDLTINAARQHAKDYDLREPVLLDPQHQLVKFLHATVTPQVVVIGKNGDVLYLGRIDDKNAAIGKHRGNATQHDLTDALAAINAGQPVKQKETEAIGCVIP